MKDFIIGYTIIGLGVGMYMTAAYYVKERDVHQPTPIERAIAEWEQSNDMHNLRK